MNSTHYQFNKQNYHNSIHFYKIIKIKIISIRVQVNRSRFSKSCEGSTDIGSVSKFFSYFFDLEISQSPWRRHCYIILYYVGRTGIPYIPPLYKFAGSCNVHASTPINTVKVTQFDIKKKNTNLNSRGFLDFRLNHLNPLLAKINRKNCVKTARR